MKSRVMEVPRRVRRTKYPYRKIRVVLRTTERRENARLPSASVTILRCARVTSRFRVRLFTKRRFDLKRKQTTFTVERINERSAGPLSRE